MAKRPTIQISSRKSPKQTRSADLVASILTAAVQVLEQEGVTRFTTTRVAEKAGVSIGSLYQYFPNKAAILFELQSNEWRQTTDMLQRLIQDAKKPPLERIHDLVHAFIRSECEEAEMRVALNDAAPLYRNTPEAREGRIAGYQTLLKFMQEALPKATDKTRILAVELLTATLISGGKSFSEIPRSSKEIKTFSDAMADMFCLYLSNLNKD